MISLRVTEQHLLDEIKFCIQKKYVYKCQVKPEGSRPEYSSRLNLVPSFYSEAGHFRHCPHIWRFKEPTKYQPAKIMQPSKASQNTVHSRQAEAQKRIPFPPWCKWSALQYLCHCVVYFLIPMSDGRRRHSKEGRAQHYQQNPHLKMWRIDPQLGCLQTNCCMTRQTWRENSALLVMTVCSHWDHCGLNSALPN